MRRTHGINIIAINRNHQTDVEISAQYCFQDGDSVTVIGNVEKIDNFETDIQS